MLFSPSFRAGAKAALPIWIAFVPSSLAFGIAAQAQGLAVEEILFMSAVVYSGPAQFAVLEPLASGRGAAQILLTTFLINLRFLPMSSALAPYFRQVSRLGLALSAHFISASSFVIPYLHFQKEDESDSAAAQDDAARGRRNLHYFLGVALTSFCVWVAGTGVGFAAALRVPDGFEEGLRFILPGYFACLLVTEVSEPAARMICLLTVLAAVPGAVADPDWGWLLAALVIGTLGWAIETWNQTSR